MGKMPLSRFAPILWCSLFAMGTVPEARAAECAALNAMTMPETTITLAESMRWGSLVPPYGEALDRLPAFCRVAGVLRPSPDSEIRFEVWMPETSPGPATANSRERIPAPAPMPWNGRLLGTGNGGFAGSIYYGQMAAMLRRGYAVDGSDGGHEAEGEDAAWAFHHPEKVKDFGWRAVHLTAVRSRQIVQAFYGRAEMKAYFDACSDGGREALMEAQRFPEDYDGILAGAPANNWARMVAQGVDGMQTTLRDPAGYISSMKLPAVTKAALATCDAQDGVKDGIINNPEMCRFDPATMLCKGDDALSCLTAPQVRTLKKLYSGGVDAHGHSIFPGFAPGDEASSWRYWIVGSGPGGGAAYQYLHNYFRYMVAEDPTWSVMGADVDRSVQQAVEKTSPDLDATDPDLTTFANRGGKLMIYHGWNDPAISPYNSIAYVHSVAEKMSAKRSGDLLRLYMVPGMEHCAGGPGASNFGQLSLSAGSGPGSGALDALETWVEHGTAPERLLSSKIAGPNKAVTMTRPICPYPEVARYKGAGDTARAESFSAQSRNFL